MSAFRRFLGLFRRNGGAAVIAARSQAASRFPRLRGDGRRPAGWARCEPERRQAERSSSGTVRAEGLPPGLAGGGPPVRPGGRAEPLGRGRADTGDPLDRVGPGRSWTPGGDRRSNTRPGS